MKVISLRSHEDSVSQWSQSVTLDCLPLIMIEVSLMMIYPSLLDILTLMLLMANFVNTK